MNLALLKVIGVCLIAFSAAARVGLVFCDMRGPWALEVVDGCAIYARYLFPSIFLLDGLLATLTVFSRRRSVVMAAVLFSLLLTIGLGLMVIFWTERPPFASS